MNTLSVESILNDSIRVYDIFDYDNPDPFTDIFIGVNEHNTRNVTLVPVGDDIDNALFIILQEYCLKPFSITMFEATTKIGPAWELSNIRIPTDDALNSIASVLQLRINYVRNFIDYFRKTKEIIIHAMHGENKIRFYATSSADSVLERVCIAGRAIKVTDVDGNPLFSDSFVKMLHRYSEYYSDTSSIPNPRAILKA